MNKKKLKVLLAGHTGFVGKNLTRLLSLNDEIDLIFASNSNGYDITKSLSLKGMKCDVIINLAGFVGIEDGWSNPHRILRDNYLITLNLLELSRENNASFIHISSYVFGIPKYQPIDESHPVSGYNPYASSKIISETLCSDYGKYFKFPITILRPFNLYGRDQKNNFLISGLVNGKNIMDIKDLNARRDYLWIQDFVNAIKIVLFNQKQGVNIYNIGSGLSYSALEIIKIIQKSSGEIVNYTQNDPEKIIVQDCRCDNRLFCSEFDWKPIVSLSQGVDLMLDLSSL